MFFKCRHPTDSTVFASAGADDQIALWDLALEKDEETAIVDPELAVSKIFFAQRNTSTFIDCIFFSAGLSTTITVYPSGTEGN